MHIAHLWESFFRCPSKPYRPFINTQFLAQVSHSTGTFPSRAEVLKCQGPWENHGNDWNYLRTGGVGARSILGGSHHHQKGGGGGEERQSFLTEYKKGGDAIESWLPVGGGGKSFEYSRALRGESGKFHCDTTKILRPLSAIIVLSPFVDCPQEPFKLGGCVEYFCLVHFAVHLRKTKATNSAQNLSISWEREERKRYHHIESWLKCSNEITIKKMSCSSDYPQSHFQTILCREQSLLKVFCVFRGEEVAAYWQAFEFAVSHSPKFLALVGSGIENVPRLFYSP